MTLTRRSALAAAIAGSFGLAGCTATDSTPTETSAAPPSTSVPPSPTPTPTPTSTLAADPLPTGIVNALVFGTDSREKASFAGNADAVLLAQLSADRTRLTLVSIARDTYIRGAKINAAYPAGGLDLLTSSVSSVFGDLPIHLTAHTNFEGLISITRWMKGITVFNQHASNVTVQSTGRVVDFPAGEITLESTDGLIYSRQRYGLPQGDLDRAERHRAVITGLIKGLQLVQKTTPNLFADLAMNLANRCMISGIELADVPALVTPLTAIQPDKITSLMLPLAGFDTIGGQSVNMVHEGRAADLAAALKSGDIDAYVAKHGTNYEPRP